MDPGLPVGPRATATPALLATIQEQYALAPIQRWSNLGGAYNLNLRLETPAGAYVARVHRPWVTPARLTAVQRLKRWLVEHTSAPQRGRRG